MFVHVEFRKQRNIDNYLSKAKKTSARISGKTLKIQFCQRKCITPIFSKVTKTAVFTFSGMLVRLFNTSQDRREKKVWIELFLNFPA